DEIRRGLPAPEPVMVASTAPPPQPAHDHKDARQLEALLAKVRTTPEPQPRKTTATALAEVTQAADTGRTSAYGSPLPAQAPNAAPMNVARSSLSSKPRNDDDIIARFASAR